MSSITLRTKTAAAALALSAVIALGSNAWAGGKSGSFKGESGHITTGNVIVEDGVIKLQGNFDFDGAPDPRIGLGKNGKYVAGTDFAVLKKNKGAQTYKIPANLKNSGFDAIYVWCRKFSVPLGHAKLK